jgi:hypothetical protein
MATVDSTINLPRGHGLDPQEYPTGNVETGAEHERLKASREYGSYTRALWDEQEQSMERLHQVWRQNIMFLSGKQWHRPTRTGVFVIDEAPEWRERPVSNICLAFFRTFLAKATKIRPAWQVIAGSTEPDDLHSAQLAEQVLEAKWVELRMGRHLRRAVAWTIITGNCFIYTFWNTDTGRLRRLEVEMEVPVLDEDGLPTGEMEFTMVGLDKEGEPLIGKDGRPTGEDPAVIDEGEVGIRVYSPFQVRVNPDAETDEDVTWFIIADTMTMREAVRRWPEQQERFVAEDVGKMDDYERAITGLVADNRLKTTAPGDDRDRELPKVLVFHYHERPSEEYPEGRYWVCTKDTVCEPPTGLPEGIWPSLIHMYDVEVPGRYHGASTMESITGLNRDYNDVNAQVKEHHNLMAKGKWLTPKGSGIKRGSITNQPGEVIEYNMGFKPEQAAITSLPPAVYQERERILQDIELVGGIHKVSFGRPPPGVTAGVAFLQLQEADDTDLGPFLAMLEESVAMMAKAVLQIIKERYDDERLIYVVGKDKKYQVRAFRGSELSGAIDLVPVAESAFPWSKTARQSMLMSMGQAMPQLFTDPETGQFDTHKFTSLLPIGGLSSMAGDNDDDLQEALREEEVFSIMGTREFDEEGYGVPQVEFWQEHMIHYRSHVRVLKTAKFKEWPEEAQAAYIEHVHATKAQMEQKAQEAAQMNAMAQGNAPKEAYQGAGGMPGAEGPPPEPGQPSPEEMAALDAMLEMEQDPGMEGMEMEPPPAFGPGMDGSPLTGLGPAGNVPL